jgi:hypothetical protein
MPTKRYKVVLTEAERQTLLALISKGKAAAAKLTRARILLQADQGLQGSAWADAQICQALSVGHKTVERTRQDCVEEGLDAALTRKKRLRSGNQKFDGSTEAHLIAVACTQAPAGHTRWTLHMLADKMVELGHFASISHETIRQHLKKMNSSHG